MKLSTATITLLPTLALAQWGTPGSPGFYHTVAEIYSAANCTAESLVWLDPIFGNGGTCQLLDRNDNTPDILSYRVTAEYPGCSATLYADNECLGTAYPAPVGECVQADGGVPLVKAFVACPFS
ncbi:hypothetical protein CC80DRAFT_482004 [Byssothecium circinans]|uniref:Uncharacterized protein n=1 Tax=Byssothecium circinans TaxID=147558 RepID=A0A6A5TF56_9PLEO|nr:hypothetical protein CC80DRAFT_482004 [Byssothecium circinans]